MPSRLSTGSNSPCQWLCHVCRSLEAIHPPWPGHRPQAALPQPLGWLLGRASCRLQSSSSCLLTRILSPCLTRVFPPLHHTASTRDVRSSNLLHSAKLIEVILDTQVSQVRVSLQSAGAPHLLVLGFTQPTGVHKAKRAIADCIKRRTD